MLKVQLTRDLRKTLLQGHPWVYSQALDVRKPVDRSQICQVLDRKGQPLGWGYYDPHSLLALRILSLAKKPPGETHFSETLARALQLRKDLLPPKTTGYRLINGEGDRLPGLVCDVYGDLAVIQFDGKGPFEFWDHDWIANWLLEHVPVKSVFLKPRRSDKIEGKSWGDSIDLNSLLVRENNHQFWVNVLEGQKTGFFFDQRDNRSYLGQASSGKSLLNLFSYTGGFSVYAGVGGASHVASVDLAKPALELAQKSWLENGLSASNHETLAVDVFEYLKSESTRWDQVVVDPPSLAHSEKNKDKAQRNYIEVFAQAAKLVKPKGDLYLSSCSSHISFNDFQSITEQALSQSRRKGQLLRISGQGPDHPFPHICPELRYLKFFHLRLD